jgi:hypothetical protein
VIIKASELQIGDVIIRKQRESGFWESTDRLIVGFTPEGWPKTSINTHFNVGHLLVKIKPRVGAAKFTGKWNGKCKKCGRGTYTGFLQVEHEGMCQ